MASAVLTSMRAYRNPALKTLDRLVFHLLADYAADDTLSAFPFRRTLAEVCNQGERKITEALYHLAREGLIVVYVFGSQRHFYFLPVYDAKAGRLTFPSITGPDGQLFRRVNLPLRKGRTKVARILRLYGEPGVDEFPVEEVVLQVNKRTTARKARVKRLRVLPRPSLERAVAE